MKLNVSKTIPNGDGVTGEQAPEQENVGTEQQDGQQPEQQENQQLEQQEGQQPEQDQVTTQDQPTVQEQPVVEVAHRDVNPSQWSILPTEDGIEATNNSTGESFVGTIAEFNAKLRG